MNETDLIITAIQLIMMLLLREAHFPRKCTLFSSLRIVRLVLTTIVIIF